MVNDEDAILVLESLPNLEYLNGHETREIQDNDEQEEQQPQQDVLPQVNEIIESNTNSNERETANDGGYDIEHVEQIMENEHEHEEETNDNKMMVGEHNSNNNINNVNECLSHSNGNNSNNINDNNELHMNTAQQQQQQQQQGNTLNNEQHIDSLENEIPNFNVSKHYIYIYIYIVYRT